MNLYLVEKDRTKILSVDFFLLGNNELNIFLIDNPIINIYSTKSVKKGVGMNSSMVMKDYILEGWDIPRKEEGMERSAA